MATDHKYKRLDSVRGLAAFSVGVGHAFLFVPLTATWGHRLLLAVFNGKYAVDTFFVLSGFVLTQMVRSFSVPSYAGYLGRRLARLYPPLWISLGVACCALMLVSAPCTAIRACQFISAPPESLRGLLRSALPTDYKLDPVIWSIRIEIAMSVAYPFVLILWRRANGASRIAILAISALITLTTRYGFDSSTPHWMLPFAGVPHFLFLFLVGIAITDYPVSKRPSLALGIGLTLMLLCGLFMKGHTGPDDLVVAASAALLISVIAYACPHWLALLLDNSLVLKLGEMSYSYYLLNAIALWVIARTCAQYLPGGLALIAFLAIAAALATAIASYWMHRAIEKPSIILSRALERYISKALTPPDRVASIVR